MLAVAVAIVSDKFVGIHRLPSSQSPSNKKKSITETKKERSGGWRERDRDRKLGGDDEHNDFIYPNLNKKKS